MDKQVSGFGYCSCTGHIYVKIYQNEANKYYVSIDYMNSQPFDDLKDAASFWAAVEEVETRRREINALGD